MKFLHKLLVGLTKRRLKTDFQKSFFENFCYFLEVFPIFENAAKTPSGQISKICFKSTLSYAKTKLVLKFHDDTSTIYGPTLLHTNDLSRPAPLNSPHFRTFRMNGDNNRLNRVSSASSSIGKKTN